MPDALKSFMKGLINLKKTIINAFFGVILKHILKEYQKWMKIANDIDYKDIKFPVYKKD